MCVDNDDNSEKNWTLGSRKFYSVVNKLSGIFLSNQRKTLIVKTFMLSQICYTVLDVIGLVKTFYKARGPNM